MVQSSAVHLPSGDEPGRLLVGGGTQRRRTGHVLVRLDHDVPARRARSRPARDAAAGKRHPADPARAGVAASGAGVHSPRLFADAVLDEMTMIPPDDAVTSGRRVAKFNLALSISAGDGRPPSIE